ncbi:hypothetical protein TraAM80_04157 [Trypanosoma rangeli]|uniref:Uncharacterized protein n=1 Tax=Trypanosoma rangeli TaxID=5698 RepID=A0A422NKS9_TRYRA|nr:uncharacterized protein TraAM80_04157 [Trypanosoma rangeli]RNF06073.1 hypothetical protein TraAM80_04157 [Trypanosoma rangeli]|eukprot:RNF06073.1 hypothetical protein TraAM80_04157 [Trypanosoma rangeli]
MDYINSYLECLSWFADWCLRSELPARTITKLCMWLYDMRHRRSGFRRGDAPSPCLSNVFGKASYIQPNWYREETGKSFSYLDERIIFYPQFALLDENEAYHNLSVQKHKTLVCVSRILRQPSLHYLRTALTVASMAFLWVVDASSELSDPQAVYISCSSCNEHDNGAGPHSKGRLCAVDAIKCRSFRDTAGDAIRCLTGVSLLLVSEIFVSLPHRTTAHDIFIVDSWFFFFCV